MTETPETIEVNGATYVRADCTIIPPIGNRAVVVIDRGWIYAGDVVEENGRIKLHRAVWVFRWERIGFAEVVANPKQEGVDIRPLSTIVDVPAESEVYRLPVGEDWGL